MKYTYQMIIDDFAKENYELSAQMQGMQSILIASPNMELISSCKCEEKSPHLIQEFTKGGRVAANCKDTSIVFSAYGNFKAEDDEVQKFAAVINGVFMELNVNRDTYYFQQFIEKIGVCKSKGFFPSINKPPYEHLGHNATKYSQQHYLGKEIAIALIDILVAEECLAKPEVRT